MLIQNFNIILALLIGILLNVISSWIIISSRNRVKFLIVTIILVGIYVSIESKKTEPAKNLPSEQNEAKTAISQKKIEPVIDTNSNNTEESKPTTLNESKKTGTFTIIDKEQNSYPTFTYNNIVWLAKNLNLSVDVDDGLCYDENPEYCKFYGKLYHFKGARKACQSLGSGWRLPTTKEFQQLFLSNLGGYYSKKGWGFVKRNGNPEKSYKNLIEGSLKGFNLQFGGVCNPFFGKEFSGIDSDFFYWADDNDIYFCSYNLADTKAIIQFDIGAGNNYMSCRCVIDSSLFFNNAK